MMLSRVLPALRWVPTPRSASIVERLSFRGKHVALIDPQDLQVLDQRVEQLQVQPANRIDQTTVLLGDEVRSNP